MTTSSQNFEASKAHARASKLGSQPVLDLIKMMVSEGASLNDICRALADGSPDRAAISVSKEAIRKRVLELGLKLKSNPLPQVMDAPSPEAVEAARREAPLNLTATGPKRNPAWLSSFEPEIRRALAETPATLAQVWDILAQRFGHISPQLSRLMSNDKKTQAIYIYIRREADKARRKNKMNWARIYLEIGREALAGAQKGAVNDAELTQSAHAKASARSRDISGPRSTKSLTEKTRAGLPTDAVDIAAELHRREESALEASRLRGGLIESIPGFIDPKDKNKK